MRISKYRIAMLMGAGLLAANLATALIICPEDGSSESQSVALFAGQNYYAGTVTVWTESGSVCVAYATEGPWLLRETHLAIADSLDGIPQTRSGNPRPGQFQWSATHNPPVQQFTYCVNAPYAVGEPLYVAAHAVVGQSGAGGGGATQTGWAGDLDFPGNNWATYFVFVPNDGCYEID